VLVYADELNAAEGVAGLRAGLDEPGTKNGTMTCPWRSTNE
jgi:hypothetical protein